MVLNRGNCRRRGSRGATSHHPTGRRPKAPGSRIDHQGPGPRHPHELAALAPPAGIKVVVAPAVKRRRRMAAAKRDMTVSKLIRAVCVEWLDAHDA